MYATVPRSKVSKRPFEFSKQRNNRSRSQQWLHWSQQQTDSRTLGFSGCPPEGTTKGPISDLEPLGSLVVPLKESRTLSCTKIHLLDHHFIILSFLFFFSHIFFSFFIFWTLSLPTFSLIPRIAFHALSFSHFSGLSVLSFFQSLFFLSLSCFSYSVFFFFFSLYHISFFNYISWVL